MKKLTFTFTMLLCGMIMSQARPVDVDVARSAAQRFATAQLALESRNATAQLVHTGLYGAYYVFNLGDNAFVIIAADDAYRPVIGYSDESAFDAADIPPALQDYLNGIAESIHRLGNQAVAVPLVAAEWSLMLERGRLLSRFGGRGTGYFCQTKWNQDYPYNCLCPEDPAGSGGHAYVGCLATAMSQLMRFWAYPAQGIGNHCYYHEDYGEICADFGNTTYDWDNMPNVLSNSSSDAEKLATGTLCFHCGVTIDMGYGPDGSGGASGPIPGVMHTYFNYCDAIVQLSRNDFETETWKTMVREQFDMGWPMYYGGCQDGGCHAFVCDGYNDYDMFHFNLGWGGGSDGWYIIDEAPYTSPADAMFNFVPAPVYNQTPVAPAEFVAEALSFEDLKTNLHWINPSVTLDGTPLDAIDQIVVLRNNEVIRTFEGVNPGIYMEMDDDDVPCYGIYHYAVYAVANGRVGKHANVMDAMVGPTCPWQIIMSTNSFQGWQGGCITVYNNSGSVVAQATTNSATVTSVEPDLPLGHLSFGWTAPTETVNLMAFVIKDAQGQTVYSFTGSSDDLPDGIFFVTNNSCGGDLSCGTPENLFTEEVESGIMLTWDPVDNQGYGYNIYRDGLLYRLVQDGHSFLDENTGLGGHCYRVSVLCDGGENGEYSNESCATFGPCYPPRNLDYELTNNYKIKLNWEAPLSKEGLSGYYLFRKEGDGEYHRIKLIGASALTYTDNATTEEGDYYYRLYAYYGDLDCTSAPANRKYETNVFELHAYYSPTSVGEAEMQVKIYPNPTEGRLTVEAEALRQLTVFNPMGQMVLQKEVVGNQATVDLQGVAAGLYLLRVATENGTIMKQVSIVR